MARPFRRSTRGIGTLACALLVGSFISPLVPPILGAQESRRADLTPTFENLSRQAAAARDADRLDEAASLYRKALQLRPQWAEGWWSLGTLEYDRNHYPAAADAFRKLLPLAPKDGTARAMLGLCEFELGRDALALKHIDEAKNLGVSTNPQLRTVVIYHEGVLLQRAGKFEAASESLAQLCHDATESPSVLLALGMVSLRMKDKTPPPAESPGGQVVAAVGRASCLGKQKKFDEARAAFSAIAADYPTYPNLHYAFGRLLVESNDVPAAIAEFKKEIENHPESVVARLEIAAAEYKTDSQAGLPYAQEAVKLNPTLPFAHYLLGLLYLDTDDYRKAIPELEAAQEAFPKDPQIYFALGSAYSRAGRNQDAARARAAFQKITAEKSASRAAY